MHENDTYETNRIKKTIARKEGKYVYEYGYDEKDRLIQIRFFRKQKIFKKLEGEYLLRYKTGKLSRQTSTVEGIGITEWISYHYDKQQRISRVEYYSGKNQLRYTVNLAYAGEESALPLSMKVVRMEKFPFFETQDRELIREYLSVFGRDFDGSFHLLDIAEKGGSIQ
jgi:hypothetical protein